MGKNKAKTALAACLAAVKVTLSANTALGNVESRITAIRYLSGTDIQLGELHLTRVPLHSLQEHLNANEAETQTVIARLALQEAMQRSKAYLNCDVTQGTCENNEFGMARAKPKPEVEPTPAKPQLPTADQILEAKPGPAADQLATLTNPEILQRLFGNYDREQDRAIIQELFLQGETGDVAEAFVKAQTRLLWSVSIDYQGAPHKLVSASRPLDLQGQPENCAECKPILGAALLGKNADDWKVEVLTPYITRAANQEDVGQPVLLEPVGGGGWLLQLESEAGETARQTVTTTLIALIPPGIDQAAAFINPLTLLTRVDERRVTAACFGEFGCQVYDVKLSFDRLAGGSLLDLAATTQGYLKTADGNRIALDKVDYYTFKNNRYQLDVLKSADLTERYRQQQCNPCLSLGRLNWPYFE